MELFRFALLGLAAGAIYGLIALGLVLVYRSSGLVNFAQGAFVVVGAYANYEMLEAGVDRTLSVVLAIIVSACCGVTTYLVVIRPMAGTSPLARVMATLGLLLAAQALGLLLYGPEIRSVESWLPRSDVNLGPLSTIGLDRIVIFMLGLALASGLSACYRLSRFGRVTTAIATNPLAASTLGHSVNSVATINWACGAALAGLAGVLAGPIIFLEPTSLVLLVLPALVAALMGGFSSFLAAFAAACVIGAAQSALQLHVTSPGWPTALPLLFVIAWLAVRGTGLPVRSHLLDRLPRVSDARMRRFPVLISAVVAVILILTVEPSMATAITATAAMAMVCLSLVVITGYGGQLSLAQYVLGGAGALTAAHVANDLGFVLATVVAVTVVAVLGMLLALPALRTRGMTLAVVTLGIAVALYGLLLSNSRFTGGPAGIVVDPPTLFGISVDPLFYPERYGVLTLLALFLLMLAVANLRRGTMGRRLLAVRSNERGATALGISVASTKLFAFTLAAAIAALGGVFLAFLQTAILPEQFSVFESIYILGATVVGGIGSVAGAPIAALLVPGGVVSELLSDFPEIDQYLPLVGAIILILNLRTAPDGLSAVAGTLLARLRRLLRFDKPGDDPSASDFAGGERPQVEPKALSVRGLSVRFGGIVAVDHADIEVAPGQVRGLLGPNGAGKTTLIDAVTGFVNAEGEIYLGDVSLLSVCARRRVRHGLARSFQSLELFDDLTVEENIAAAADRVPWWRPALDLVWPNKARIDAHAAAVIKSFGISDLIDKKMDELSYGQRKAVAVVRALASRPSVLLLDEPAAGLDDHEATQFASLISRMAHEWGIAVLLVEHKVDMVLSTCDRITVMHMGRVIAEGPPEVVRLDPHVRDAYFGVPV